MKAPVKVLVVDDSALARQIISSALDRDPRIDVIGTATDAYDARDKIVVLRPDVLTLDVEMPRMDGVQFLKRLMPQYPIPVVVVSALTYDGAEVALEALASGAVDFVPKPSAAQGQQLGTMIPELIEKILVAAQTDVSMLKDQAAHSRTTRRQQATLRESSTVIAVGASTGGTVALTEIIRELPPTIPGMVVVQHMPALFTTMFADRLNKLSAVEVREAANGDSLHTGLVLVAPGGVHTVVERVGKDYMVHCEGSGPVKGHCPSVDVLMHSVARCAGKNAVGVILTGMGADGAEGLLAMREAGARTLAQDEESSVVFGMPKMAIRLGGAEKLVTLDNISREIVKLCREKAA